MNISPGACNYCGNPAPMHHYTAVSLVKIMWRVKTAPSRMKPSAVGEKRRSIEKGIAEFLKLKIASCPIPVHYRSATRHVSAASVHRPRTPPPSKE
eukprot:7383053-Prymnesium_polylepis.1